MKRKKEDAFLHVGHFPLVSLCLGIESPPGEVWSVLPKPLQEEVLREAGFATLIPILQSLPCFLVFLTQVQSSEKQHRAQEAQCPHITPILQRSHRGSET